jgi:hypothetical protein
MPERANRILYFHTGTPKTGSTALQLFLHANSAALSAAGVSYEFPVDPDTSAGNGAHLRQRLFDHYVPPADLDGLLDAYFAGRGVAVCSSEHFTFFRREEWHQVTDAAARLGIRLRTITYVRDVVPYYYSAHAQLLKTGKHDCSINDYCEQDCYRPVIDSLGFLHDLIGRDAMTVIHYKSTIGDIDAPFLAALPVQIEGLDRSILGQRVNRSPTQLEQEILRETVQLTGNQIAEDLWSHFLQSRPDAGVERKVDAALCAKLAARHDKGVKWLNTTFFGGADVVRIIDDRLVAESQAIQGAETQQALYRNVARWCLSRLASSQDSSISFIAEQLRQIDWKKIGHPALPPDFDPIAYLLCNPDVLKSGARPCEHYVSHGRHEGRRWRWESR